MVILLDSIHVHNFYGHMIAGVKMFQFLVLIWAHLYMLIIKKDILALVESPKQGLDNTSITAEARYLIDFRESGNYLW